MKEGLSEGSRPGLYPNETHELIAYAEMLGKDQVAEPNPLAWLESNPKFNPKNHSYPK
ncbi:hypothetical protein BCR34DRAFT_552580 [Clohesyomyces aquaticus]|uniref:Uncharacterized protein n=1 Tax=Clohesyomyces aquaticus TaxID=1231657 RepID=A0A1Y2A9C3_9PLEO|nr:hypothetical protein BCR34DRAFT_552580 [Clohesyomyces aquaticus]